jgi:glycosyltransferase involved in cell wall biosynthesis
MPVDTIHVESNKVEVELTQYNPKARPVVIYNGVEIQEYSIATPKSEYNKFILYLRRLIIRKNLQVVILTFKNVVKMIPEAKLMVAGDGPMRQEWQELVNKNDLSKNIIFLGHVSENL